MSKSMDPPSALVEDLFTRLGQKIVSGDWISIYDEISSSIDAHEGLLVALEAGQVSCSHASVSASAQLLRLR